MSTDSKARTYYSLTISPPLPLANCGHSFHVLTGHFPCLEEETFIHAFNIQTLHMHECRVPKLFAYIMSTCEAFPHITFVNQLSVF